MQDDSLTDGDSQIVECLFCGAALPPDRAVEFLERAGDEDELSPISKPPTCADCQSGIDENERERQARPDPGPTAGTAYGVKLLFVIFLVGLMYTVLEPLLKGLVREFQQRR